MNQRAFDAYDVMRFVGGPLNGRTVLSPGWPPPEQIQSEGTPGAYYERKRMSALTDEEMATMTNVARGAEYEWVEDE